MDSATTRMLVIMSLITFVILYLAIRGIKRICQVWNDPQMEARFARFPIALSEKKEVCHLCFLFLIIGLYSWILLALFGIATLVRNGILRISLGWESIHVGSFVLFVILVLQLSGMLFVPGAYLVAWYKVLRSH